MINLSWKSLQSRVVYLDSIDSIIAVVEISIAFEVSCILLCPIVAF